VAELHGGPHYYVVLYDRRTDRWCRMIEVRPRLRDQVIEALGIEPLDYGEMALGPEQLGTLAEIMDFTPDLERFAYTFETVPG
jgi:hypothetical protein